MNIISIYLTTFSLSLSKLGVGDMIKIVHHNVVIFALNKVFMISKKYTIYIL